MTAKTVASILGVVAVWAVSGCLFLLHTLAKQSAEVGTLQAALAALSMPPASAPAAPAAPVAAGSCAADPTFSPDLGVSVQDPRLVATEEGVVLTFDLRSTTPGTAVSGTIGVRGMLDRADAPSVPAAAVNERYRVANRVTKSIVLAKGADARWSSARLELVFKGQDGRERTVGLPELRTNSLDRSSPTAR